MLTSENVSDPTTPPLSVCFVSPEYPRAATAGEGIGGISTHTYTLAHAVAGLGHRVVVLTDSPDRAETFVDRGVRVHALAARSSRTFKVAPYLPVAWVRRSLATAAALRRLQREHRFDVVSFPDGGAAGYFYSYAPRVPFVVQLFGPASLVQRWDGRRVPAARARAEAAMERRPIQTASLLISSTRRYAEIIRREWPFRPERVRIVRNPLNIEMFRPPDAREPAAGRSSRKTVLFVGHLQKLKGLLTLAAAIPAVVQRHPDAEFHLIGNDTPSAPDGGSMKRFLERTLGEAGLLRHVTFGTPVPQAELARRYPACAVFVLPSLADVYPNAVLEAMACGRPCITTDATGVAELIEDGRSGFLVPAGDAGALGGAIARALDMPAAEREEIGRRARCTVAQACATPAIAAASVAAYRELLAARRR